MPQLFSALRVLGRHTVMKSALERWGASKHRRSGPFCFYQRVFAGQVIIVPANEWVQYSTPDEGAEYIAVCLPAFTPGAVHRD